MTVRGIVLSVCFGLSACGGGGDSGGGSYALPEATSESSAESGVYMASTGAKVTLSPGGSAVYEDPADNFCVGPYTTSDTDEMTFELNCNSFKTTTQTVERFQAKMTMSLFPFLKATALDFEVITENTNLETIKFAAPAYGDDFAFKNASTDEGMMTLGANNANDDLTLWSLNPGHYLMSKGPDTVFGLVKVTNDMKIETVRGSAIGLLKNEFFDDWCAFSGSVASYIDNGKGQSAAIVLDASLSITECNYPSTMPANAAIPTQQELDYEMFYNDLVQEGSALLFPYTDSLNEPKFEVFVTGADQSDGKSLGHLVFDAVCVNSGVAPSALTDYFISPADDFTCSREQGYWMLSHPTPPTITSPQQFTVDAGTFTIGEVSATSTYNPPITFALTGTLAPEIVLTDNLNSADASLAFDAGTTTTAGELYEVTVTVTDSMGLKATQNIEIRVR